MTQTGPAANPIVPADLVEGAGGRADETLIQLNGCSGALVTITKDALRPVPQAPVLTIPAN